MRTTEVIRTEKRKLQLSPKDFLNKLLGLSLRGYQKSSKKLDDGTLLWMIRLDGKVSDAGWRNYLSSTDEITEEHIGHEFVFDGHHTYVGGGEDFESRVVFDLVDFGSYRKYVFRGVFRIDKEKCTLNKNIWYKISDNYNF